MSNSRGFSRIGLYVYAFGTFAAGIFDLVWGNFDAAHQPLQAWGDNIPGAAIFAYITGVWMVAGALALLWQRSERGGGAALAAIYFVFTMFWLPRFHTAPSILGYRASVYIGVFAGFGSQLIVCGAGALIYASLANGSLWPRMMLVARWIFGICSIDFGLGHLTDVRDNIVYVPKWMLFGQEFWVILTGICFVLAGLAILIGILDTAAAWLLGLEFLAFNIVKLPSYILADPHEHAAWGGNAYNLAAVGASWILADQLARWKRERRRASLSL
jgi:uncharacterized membrane protein YphA (DoxX/SURF4 family)